jgi:hypothetical protein
MYNTTSIENAKTVFDVFLSINDLTGGWIFIFLMIAIWIISFISTRNDNYIDQFIISSFITTIVGVFLVFAELIGWYVFMFPLIMLIGSILYKQFVQS